MDSTLRNLERKALEILSHDSIVELQQARSRYGLCVTCGINKNPNPDETHVCTQCDRHLIDWFNVNRMDTWTEEIMQQIPNFCRMWSVIGFKADQPQRTPPKWIDDCSYAQYQGDPQSHLWEDLDK